MEAALFEAKAAIDAYHDDDGDEYPTKEIELVSMERVNAFQSGNQSTLTSLDEKMASDLSPLYSTLEEHGDKAFNVIHDKHGKEIFFCGNRTAMLWVRITEDKEAKARAPTEERDTFTYNPTVEVGTMSVNGGKSVMSKSWWQERIPHLTIAAIAGGLGYVVGKSILGALTKRGIEAAEIAAAGAVRAEAQAALDAARTGGNKEEIIAAIKRLREARKVVDRLWMRRLPKAPWAEKLLNLAARFPRISSFLGGSIVALAISIVLELVLPFINKDYYVKMVVCNFDAKNDWKIDADWHHDNGIIAGGSAFQGKRIPRADQTVETPWGPEIGKYMSVSTVTYYFQNSVSLLVGVGVCVKAQRADQQAGCVMAYLCSFWTANQLTVKNEFPASCKNFYWDNRNWPTDQKLKVTDSITTPEGKLPLQGNTNALRKADGNLYKFHVGIGEPPNLDAAQMDGELHAQGWGNLEFECLEGGEA